MTARASLLLLLATVPACGDDRGILELDLGLPARDATRQFAFVQARSAPEPFDAVWEGDDPDGIALEATSQRAAVSVVASDPHLEPALRIKVRLCATARCADLGDTGAGRAFIEIERAFYLGERTFASADVPALAPGDTVAITVPKCEVRGCIGGTTSTFCRGDGTHFCE